MYGMRRIMLHFGWNGWRLLTVYLFFLWCIKRGKFEKDVVGRMMIIMYMYSGTQKVYIQVET